MTHMNLFSRRSMFVLYIIIQSRHMDCAFVISKRLLLHKLSSSNYTCISEKFFKKNRFQLLIILNKSNNVVLYYLTIIPKMEEHVCRWITIIIKAEKTERVISVLLFLSSCLDSKLHK